jgi:hypothetical protein
MPGHLQWLPQRITDFLTTRSTLHALAD